MRTLVADFIDGFENLDAGEAAPDLRPLAKARAKRAAETETERKQRRPEQKRGIEVAWARLVLARAVERAPDARPPSLPTLRRVIAILGLDLSDNALRSRLVNRWPVERLTQRHRCALSRVARAAGLSIDVVQQRLRRGARIDDPATLRPPRVYVHRSTLPRGELAARARAANLDPKVVSSRLAAGWPIEQALATPVTRRPAAEQQPTVASASVAEPPAVQHERPTSTPVAAE